MLEEVPGPGEVPARDVVNRTIKMQRTVLRDVMEGVAQMRWVQYPTPTPTTRGHVGAL